MKNLDENISMNQREKIQASIEMLRTIGDKMVVAGDWENEPYPYLLNWLVVQLQQSLLVLDTIPDE